MGFSPHPLAPKSEENSDSGKQKKESGIGEKTITASRTDSLKENYYKMWAFS